MVTCQTFAKMKQRSLICFDQM